MVTFIDYDPANPNSPVTAPLASRRRLLVPKVHLKLPAFLKRKKFWGVLAAVIIILGIPTYLFLVRPAQELLAQAMVDKAEAQKIQADITAQNIVTVDSDLKTFEQDLANTRSKLDYFGFTNIIPWLGDYYRDGRHLLLAGQYAVAGGKIATTALIPYADVLGLSGKGTGTNEEKLQKVVEIMPKLAPETDKIKVQVDLANSELANINPDRYPTTLGGIKVRDTLSQAKDLASLVSGFMPEAKDVLTNAPIGLGSPTPKTYMVLFQNDKELRPSGGFLTAYTYATFNKGKISTSSTNDIYNLDQTIDRKPRAPAPILKYLPLVNVWNLRDSNLSPDYWTSMATFETMYRKSSEYKPVDGYIAVDTFFLQSLLRLVGPVKTVSTGDTFTADNVVTKMETYAEQVFRNAPNRKGFLGELMKEILGRVLHAKSDQWVATIQTMLTAANEKHFLLMSHDAPVQNLIEKYDWGGRIKAYDGDYFHLNDSNFAGAKANLYITEKIVQDITVGSDGTVTKKVTVTETNTGKYDGWLNGTYRDWVRMYVPAGSSISSTNGTVKTASQDLGKTYFENFIQVVPVGFNKPNYVTWTITYTLPTKVTGHTYKELIQKQPGVDGPEVVISINGQEKVNEPLKTDKEFTLSF